jgi:hypothetical protein
MLNKAEKMSTLRLPRTDEERINILQAIITQEEINEDLAILSMSDLQELRIFTTSFEGVYYVYKQAISDRNKTKEQYAELFKNAQLYISHFIQVLLLTVIRNEIKSESFPLYGLQENNPVLPDLSSEESVLLWGENLIRGESERTYRGGIPLYNPAIAKVKVHYELFKESIHSLAIYEKNLKRVQSNMDEMRKKATEIVRSIWSGVEERYNRTPPDEQALRFKAYKIQYFYRKGDQLNVFD